MTERPAGAALPPTATSSHTKDGPTAGASVITKPNSSAVAVWQQFDPYYSKRSSGEACRGKETASLTASGETDQALGRSESTESDLAAVPPAARLSVGFNLFGGESDCFCASSSSSSSLGNSSEVLRVTGSSKATNEESKEEAAVEVYVDLHSAEDLNSAQPPDFLNNVEPFSISTKCVHRAVRFSEAPPDTYEFLTQLSDVTALSRSLIAPELLQRRNKTKKRIMASRQGSSTSSSSRPSLGGFRRRLSGRKGKDENGTNDDEATESINSAANSSSAQPLRNARNDNARRSPRDARSASPTKSSGRSSATMRLGGRRANSVSRAMQRENSDEDDDSDNASRQSGSSRTGRQAARGNVFSRLRSRSRSRSKQHVSAADNNPREMLVAVTSCRSDGYYNQKAPGSTSKLPRKAPTNLKLFHELAVGVKDAYAAVGATPRKPTDGEERSLSRDEFDGKHALWDFVGNLDFLLALVDEVAVDSVTRGALKDDSTFKGLRDVIKKGNRVLEEMLVRRERKYTLFFRLVQAHEKDQIERMKNWNRKVEKAVGAVTGGRETLSESGSESEGETASASSASSHSSAAGSSVSSRAGVLSRGRQLLPAAGRVRSRRATPTPRLRRHRSKGDLSASDSDSNAAEDGFSAVTTPDLASQNNPNQHADFVPNGLNAIGRGHSDLTHVVAEPKDELVDVIRGLRVEKLKNKDGSPDEDLAALKPNWRPKAEIPSAVPKLPIEYVHRHRLMKQVVSCLLDESEAPANGEGPGEISTITCVTSRHGDKAGNGKSTLAIAVIQTVEVRERFYEGIAWLKLGRGPLSDRDIRRLYEDLYRQLIVKEADIEATESELDPDNQQFHDSFASIRTDQTETRFDKMVDRADSVRRFQGGDLEGIKEDLGRMLVKRNVLVCLDDVCRVEDAKWFIFETPSYSIPPRNSPFKILITTRTPALFGQGTVQEVFVRILSEHEAVKLLLSTAGRRPYGGRSSAVFNQSKLIVKGCGNSPLGVLLVGSMLRNNNRNWNLNSPVWMGIFNQCSLNLEEAAQLRSFKNAFLRIVDMSFFTIEDTFIRIALRRCFVLFAMAFKANDWLLSGKGIPQSVLLKFFGTVISSGPTGEAEVTAESILVLLENLKLIQRARHSVSPPTRKIGNDNVSVSSHGKDNENSEKSDSEWDDYDEAPKRAIQQFYTMHDSLKAIAEAMAERPMPAFTPDDDQHTYFSDCIEAEESASSRHARSWQAPFRFLVESLASTNGSKSRHFSDEQVHELVAVSLLGGNDANVKALAKASISEAMKANQMTMQAMKGGDKFEEYTMAFMPEHLMLSRSYTNAAELLMDSDFVRRRVFALGIMEATGRQVADILDLRSFTGKGAAAKKPPNAGESPTKSVVSPEKNGEHKASDFDVEESVCEASRIVIDEVYKVTNNMGQSDSLGMATCLATIGETLLRCRQPRDAMLRLEEAVSIYRGLLGPYHVYVGHALHSVAKALGKLGETRVALLKFAEAARIYEQCNATLHYDSIMNAQALAALLVDIGDIRKAESMFEEVIAMKQAVYGEASVPVAKTVNSYAILLAKHGRMDDALRNYEIAKDTYIRAPPGLVVDPEFEVKCNYDVTLITLNIASIYSKKGDLKKALESYEDGVRGLEDYEAEMERFRQINGTTENVSKSSSHKHLIAALGRIGSLKLKLGDNVGALEAYEALIDQVNDDSPIASHNEEAKAHIKCATIYRQSAGDEAREKSVLHLREALRMYKALYGTDHKDTTAIATSLKQWLAEDRAKS